MTQFRSIDFRYSVLRNGSELTQLRAVSNPTVKMKGDSEVKTSFTGEFLDPGDTVNWLIDEIRPEIIIDGAPHSLGVYIPGTVKYSKNETQKTVSVEAYDRCWLIKDHYTETTKYFSTGTNYITAIINLLTECGIALITATPTTATLAEAREDWNIGTSYIKIINQLLTEINYKPLWFNREGVAILEPVSIPTAANIQHVLDNTDPKTMIYPSIANEMDVYNAPNVFMCVCSNADKSGPMVAIAENTNPQSPLSVQRRGRRIAKVVNVSNIASQSELQKYADDLRNKSMITGETITVKTGLMPDFGVNDVTAIRYVRDNNGLNQDEVFDICLEKAWSMSLTAGGQMTHTLEKVVVAIG